MIERIIPTKIIHKGRERVLPVPTFPHEIVPPYFCSRYVKLAARDLFNLDYATCAAWDRPYQDKLIQPVSGFDDLQRLLEQGVLTPGMVIGTQNPQTKLKGKLDCMGKKATFTHNMLFLGKAPDGDLKFAHQFVYDTDVEGIAELKSNRLKPLAIIAPRDYAS